MDQLQERLAQALPERYAIKAELGRGGMAVVFLAWDRKHECDVALKVLRPELSATLGPARFLQEIKTAARLKHPYILKLLDSDQAGGLLYYVMPYVEAESLRQRLTREGRLPIPDALRITREVAEALQYAHEQDVVHRDIKPENILFEGGHALVSDFGIALAISAADSRDTGSGVVLGTIEYMSPEQARGSRDIDNRTDIYSLGVLLYEMLVGEPPHLEVEGTAKTLERLRPDVPPALVDVLKRALASNPRDRFATAERFAYALAQVGGWTHLQRRVAAAAVAAVGAALAAWRIFGDGAIRIEAQRYVIVPFSHTRGAAPTLLDGDLCARLLYQGFAQWADVNVTEPLRVSDALHRLHPDGATGPLTLEDGLELARGLGAGRLVRGELWQFRDTTYVSAAVYDLTRGGREVTSRAIRLVPGMSEGVVFYALADSLLFAGSHPPPGSPAGRATTSTRALLAHEEGHKALDAWDLTAAATGFRRAVAYDSGFGHAFLELAQVKAWQELPVESWRDTAVRAARLADRLAPRERLLASALEAMGAERQDQACRWYRQLLARDSLDATAWYGLGECHAKDRVVLRDSASPSGWQFRGSYHAATLAYRRALDLAPSLNMLFRGQVYAHLAELLYTEPHQLRSGRPLPPDTGLFAAYPDFIDDTLAFVPYRAMLIFNGQAGAPRHGAEATVRTREVLGDIVTAWVRAFPAAAEAHDATAEWLEAQGRLGVTRGDAVGALSEIRSARRLATDTARLPLAVSEVRILLKLQDFSSARRLADSLLAANPEPDAQGAAALSSIALLTGRVTRAAALLQRAAPRADPPTLQGRPLGAPLPVLEGVAPFIAYAAAGGPRDSIRAAARRADSLLRSWIPPPRQALARQALLLPALTIAFELLGPSPIHAENSRNYLVELQWRLARGDSAAVRSRLAEMLRRRSTLRGGEIAVDGVYQEARLLLTLHDTVGARDHIDKWLSSLAVSRRSLLWQPNQTGAFVRMMALRAELAVLAGDHATAKRWAQNVVVLWSDADADLQNLVARMRRI